MVMLALAVAYKDLSFYQYPEMLQNVYIHSCKKDAHVISMGFLVVQIYCYFWTRYGYLGGG